MKVLIFGSRKWLDQKPIEALLRTFPPGTIVVEGDASGADRIAGYVAQRLGLIVRAYPALAHGRTWPSAGPLRNQEMLDREHPDRDGVYIDRAFCFHEDPNLGRGSQDMRQRILRTTPEIPLVIQGRAVKVFGG